jgi:hypothetical protein
LDRPLVGYAAKGTKVALEGAEKVAVNPTLDESLFAKSQ